jgi:hypothetical protein
MSTAFTSRFAIGDRVYIDGDKDLVAVVVGHWFSDGGTEKVSVSWVSNAELKEEWVAHWRLGRVDP